MYNARLLSYFALGILHFNFLYSFKLNEKIEKMNALQHCDFIILPTLSCADYCPHILKQDK
jgi:hypothetical protein